MIDKYMTGGPVEPVEYEVKGNPQHGYWIGRKDNWGYSDKDELRTFYGRYETAFAALTAYRMTGDRDFLDGKK